MYRNSVLITPNDYTHIGRLFGDQGISTVLPGFDMLLITKRCLIPIERKVVPGDLIASVQDGRLYKELVAMRQVSPFYVVLYHGEILYDRDDFVAMPRGVKRTWTKTAMCNLRRSLEHVEGAFIEEAKTNDELVRVVNEIQVYFDGNHGSLRNRPPIESDWLVPDDEERLIYFYSGIPGIKAGRAKPLVEKFPCISDLLVATVKDLTDTSGIGKKTATDIYEFLRKRVN